MLLRRQDLIYQLKLMVVAQLKASYAELFSKQKKYNNDDNVQPSTVPRRTCTKKSMTDDACCPFLMTIFLSNLSISVSAHLLSEISDFRWLPQQIKHCCNAVDM
jgi:hypothetical protein